MILRLVRGVGTAVQLRELQAALDARLAEAAGRPHGLRRYHLAARPAGDWVEALVLSLWETAEDAAAGDARSLSPLAMAIDAGLLDIDTAHFEIDEPILRSGSDEPIAIRIATGTFSKRGTDIEMLDLLRERLPLIGDAVSEAYVGRRLLDRAVEVTFVSAWRSLPAEQPLEEPFWPDIALRYDRFAVDVFGPLSSLAGIG